ncbi:MAG: GNAT family N-acetyltransferase [Flavobacteriaceae bacterium]
MKEYLVRQYTSDDFDLWNEFIAKAKNATFLFHRNFMEYHKDRFEDFSLLVFDENKLVAVVPANKKDDEFHSHQGLTYGGIVINETIKLQEFIFIFDGVCAFLNPKFKKIYFKVLPAIYAHNFADELLYVMFLKNATLYRRDTLSVIDYQQKASISSKRKYEIRKGEKYNLQIKQTNDFSEFWNEILIPNLQQKYNTNPVHSLEEISLLQNHFPEHIKQYNVYFEGKIIGGTTVFETDNVAHIQYISSNELRSKTGSLDYLFDFLIDKYAAEKRFFDFGISNENNGKTLNEGLLYWKESFGAKTVVQDFYELDLT